MNLINVFHFGKFGNLPFAKITKRYLQILTKLFDHCYLYQPSSCKISHLIWLAYKLDPFICKSLTI